MTTPIRSPHDAPEEWRKDVEEFKIIAKKLGCSVHYAPSVKGDDPPDLVIVTNSQIMQEQAVTQQVLETLLVMKEFSWVADPQKTDGLGVFNYRGNLDYGHSKEITAANLIEAIMQVVIPSQ